MHVATRLKRTTPSVQIPWNKQINKRTRGAEDKQVSRLQASMESTPLIRIAEYTLGIYYTSTIYS